ncbi:hypothetical protein B9Z55_015840 [Caenorhabditis nigoni]|uniref:Uncharacterized protein n=1 Tax=Caenorhabditis nigoni TaxID=1611254 RepID=A0A2G5UC27_9PELO|nr:hypothetical protein B9Z55_015840 [Caenorhabditis nigoni]
MQLTEEEFAQQEYNEGFWCWYWSNCLEVLGRDKNIEEHKADYAEHLKNQKDSEDYKANSSLSVVTVIEVDNQDESSGSETDVEPSALNESDSSQESTREKIGNLRLAGKDEVTKKSIGIPASLNPEMWESDSD